MTPVLIVTRPEPKGAEFARAIRQDWPEPLDVMPGDPAGDMALEEVHGDAPGRAAQEGVLADLRAGMGADLRHGDQHRVE